MTCRIRANDYHAGDIPGTGGLGMATRGFDSQDIGRVLRRGALGIVLLVVILWLGCSSTTRVDAGHVGVLVKLAGGSSGVQPEPLDVGWHIYNPLTSQIILFPTSVQNIVWTQSPHEGAPVDESITFSSTEGANINADIGLSFHVDAKLAPQLYNRFRTVDLMSLANGYIHNTVREAFNNIASKMQAHDIYGAAKNDMLKSVTAECRDVLGKDGIAIDQLTINGALRLPQTIADAINRKLETDQNTQQSLSKVAQVRAEADQQIAAAHGAAEAARQKAQGEADAILIRARGEAQANEIIRLSMTPAVLQYRALERWDGKLPQYAGGDKLPLLTFDVNKLDAGMSEADRQKRLKELMDATRPASSASPPASSAGAAGAPQAPAPPPPPAPAGSAGQ
jgi:regulator of protease activity HflC (stomatin/prohibitin superfamily)